MRGDDLQIIFLDFLDRFLIHFAERQLLPNPGLDQLWCHRCQDFLTKKLVLAFAPQTFHFTFRLNLNTSAMCFKWSWVQSVARKGAESPNGGRQGGSPRSIDTSATSNSTALWFGLIFTRLKQRYDFVADWLLFGLRWLICISAGSAVIDGWGRVNAPGDRIVFEKQLTNRKKRWLL